MGNGAVRNHELSHLAGLDLGDVREMKIPQAGDILRAPNGVLRVVRHVSLCNNARAQCIERKTWIFFTIRRCSWTRRCYTLYNIAELREMGYVHTGKRVAKWADKFQERIDRVIESGSAELTCCDVEGIS
jgi:hypothetical protein